jgi:hypothetical protein
MSNGARCVLSSAPHAKSYVQPEGWIKEALANTEYLMQVAEKTLDNPLRDRGKIPQPETNIRITPQI